MAALWRSDPRLAQRIDEVHDDERLPLLATRSGHFTASLKTPDGRTLLHSRYDPIAEAKKLIDTVEMDENFCYLVNGFGLGYHVSELLSRLKGEAFLVVCDQDFTGRFPVGDLHDEGLSALWLGEVMSRARDRHRNGQFDATPLCTPCQDWHRP